MNINYKSDFAILVNVESGMESYPWRVLFGTRTDEASPVSGCYIASFDGESYHSARRVEGEEEYNLIIELCDHGLPAGELVAEWSSIVQNTLFEQGVQRIVAPYIAPITLVEGASDDYVDSALMPYISPIIQGEKGEKGDTGEKGEKGDQGEPGESVLADIISVENDSVKIDEDGIYIAPTPLDNNNVLGGILSIFEIDEDGELINSWIHPDVGEYAYIGVLTNDSVSRKIIFYNAALGYDASEYAVIGTAWQGELTAAGGGTMSVSRKVTSGFTLSGFDPDGAAFMGGFVIVFSTRHLWY